MTEARVTMPRVSEAIDDSSVVEWLVAVGDTVVENDVLLKVETDKAIVDIESTATGRLVQQLAGVDDEIHTGNDIAVIETD